MNYQPLQTALKSATTYRKMQGALKKARDEFNLDIPCNLNAKKEKLVAAIAILIKFCELSSDADASFYASVEIKRCLTDEEEQEFIDSMRYHFGDRMFVA
jgi:hypothetical protein